MDILCTKISYAPGHDKKYEGKNTHKNKSSRIIRIQKKQVARKRTRHMLVLTGVKDLSLNCLKKRGIQRAMT